MKELNNLRRKVFLSYQFQDNEKINMVRKCLEERGFEIISNTAIPASEEVSKFVSDKIDESDCFILIISDKATEWLIKEYEIALEKQKKIFVYIKEGAFAGKIKEHRIVCFWKDENELAIKIIEDISRYGYAYPQREYEIELLVEDIFKYYGCITKRTAVARDGMYDIYAEKDKNKFYIEVKASRYKVIPNSIISQTIVSSQLLELEKNEQILLIIANSISSKMQEVLKRLSNIVVVDIGNLLYMVQNNENLRYRLLSLLEFSIDDIELQKPGKLMDCFDEEPQKKSEEKTAIECLIEEIQNWNPKETTSREYEQLCVRTLNTMFASDLGLWKDQQRSNEDLYRFDLICKIKDDVTSAFWKFVEKYFKSKYIIFEFKNYTDKISQKEIYTTDKYLYAKALRSVAIMVSCYGEDKNARKAMKGTLRENGKLILSISNEDLIAMLEGMQDSSTSPAEYLYGKLDTWLIELDK